MDSIVPFANTKKSQHHYIDLFGLKILPNTLQSFTQQRFQRLHEGDYEFARIKGEKYPIFTKGTICLPLGFLVNFLGNGGWRDRAHFP